MRPNVSVVMPVYNGERYLAEALDSVLAQSEQDWNLVIVNNCSTDGTVAVAEDYAARDPRIGIHHNDEFVSACDNWSNALGLATGRYVLALACDDLISPGFLEAMSGALDAHPECGIAHSMLGMIDDNGEDTDNWWEKVSVFVLANPKLVTRRHIRRAPLDGLLHLAGETVYVTPTQLLFRRSLVDEVGGFEGRWGNVGDFNWGMRMAFAADTIHVPEALGVWRIHAAQATASNVVDTDEHLRKVREMVDDAIDRSESRLDPQVWARLKTDWAPAAAEMRESVMGLNRCLSGGTAMERRMFLAKGILGGSPVAREHVRARFRGESFEWREFAPKLIKKWLVETGTDDLVVPV